jgi:hypothetical protein
MRGKDEQQLDVFSYISPEQRVPHDHRTVRLAETYHGNRYEGVLKTKTASAEVTSDYKARRLGDCH